MNTLREQIIDDALLFGSGAVRGSSEFHADTGNFLFCLFSSFTSNDPKVRCVIGHDSKFVRSPGAIGAAGAVRWRRRSLATAYKQDGKQHASKTAQCTSRLYKSPWV